MHARLKQRIESLTSELWFIPALLTAVAVGLAAAMLRLDHIFTIAAWAEQNPILFTSGDGARSLLATIAGSTISVAGVIFSITILVLSTAARQFGPGLLGNFMHHRGTQVVLGAFVGTFSYSLIVLRFVDVESDFVPHLAANVGMLLGLVSFFLLIYFIHHVATFIQVTRVVEDVAGRMERTLRQAFPERESTDDGPDDEARSRLADEVNENGEAVLATNPGYLQAVEHSMLVELAKRRDLVIRLEYRPGHFIVTGAIVACVVPAERVDDKICSCIRDALMLGAERSETQDPEYAIHQLVQIAVRALSPGINDPYTAITCLDRIGGALARLATRQLPSRYFHEDGGKVRLVVNPLTYAGVVQAAFNQIRQMSEDHVAVILRMLDIIAELARRELPNAFRAALREQLDAIETRNNGRFDIELDRREFERRRNQARDAFKSAPDRKRK